MRKRNEDRMNSIEKCVVGAIIGTGVIILGGLGLTTWVVITIVKWLTSL
jgi:hypothetical protein